MLAPSTIPVRIHDHSRTWTDASIPRLSVPNPTRQRTGLSDYEDEIPTFEKASVLLLHTRSASDRAKPTAHNIVATPEVDSETNLKDPADDEDLELDAIDL